MRKSAAAFLALIILLFLCGCSKEQPEGDDSGSELLNSQNLTTPEVSPQDGTSPEIPESPEPSPGLSGDTETAEIFRSFLDENYSRLEEAGGASVAGIGFIDLDLDGSSEMILFDDGASASMGVNIFDIIDGKVHCISANTQMIGAEFGGKYLSEIVICANFMEDFRLLEDSATGERFVVVESYNGNIEATYSELIRFGKEDGLLTLNSIMYKYEEYDVETGDVTAQKFRVGHTDAMLSGYTSFSEDFYNANADLGLECRGVFVWETADYVKSRENFMLLVDQAIALAAENAPPVN